jgi:endonuclease G
MNHFAVQLPRVCAVLTLLLGGFGATSTLAEDYRIGLCFGGCPQGAADGDELILRPIYAMAYNTDTKSADWVAYKVSAGSIGIASNLSREPVPDNFIADTLDGSDFQELEGTGLVRSQYVPMVNFAGTPYWQDVNYATNVVARSSALNQGAWYGLEWAIRNLVNKTDLVYVVTGPVFRPVAETPQLHTDKAHRVPDAFFKVIVTEDGQSAAFLLEQNAAVYVHHCDLRTSIAEIEAITGLTLFPEADVASFLPLDTSLGCI